MLYILISLKKKYSMTCNNLSHVNAKTVGTDLPGIDDPIKIKKRYKKNWILG